MLLVNKNVLYLKGKSYAILFFLLIEDVKDIKDAVILLHSMKFLLIFSFSFMFCYIRFSFPSGMLLCFGLSMDSHHKIDLLPRRIFFVEKVVVYTRVVWVNMIRDVVALVMQGASRNVCRFSTEKPNRHTWAKTYREEFICIYETLNNVNFSEDDNTVA